MKRMLPTLSLLTDAVCGNVNNITGKRRRSRAFLALVLIWMLSAANMRTMAQAPNFSYSPKNFILNNAVTPVGPATSGVGAPGYNPSAVNYASGFTAPTGTAVDAAGNVYLADAGANTITKIPFGGGNASKVVIGSGFNSPHGVAVDAAGNVYVADYGNNAIKVIPVGGGAPTTIGSGFSSPYSVALDAAGNVYVADQGNHAVKKIPVGGGAPVAVGSGFVGPTGIAVDNLGNVYVADAFTNTVTKVPAGGGAQTAVGSGFSQPQGVAVDVAGNVYVCDAGNSAVKEVPANGGAIVALGSGFFVPVGIAIANTTTGNTGYLYVSDNGDGLLREIIPSGGYYVNAMPPGLSFNNTTGFISGTPTKVAPVTIYTVTAYSSTGGATTPLSIKISATSVIYTSPHTYIVNTAISPLSPTSIGVAAPGYSSTPLTIGSGFALPAGVSGDIAGNVFVADKSHNAIKKIPVGGGAPVTLGSGFNAPTGTAVDALGNIFVADAGNNQVKKIPFAGGAPVVIGTGFSNPVSVAVDAAGNVYVADFGNHAVKKIAASGGATTTLSTAFTQPYGIASDAAGNLFIADAAAVAIKEISAAGALLTIGSGLTNPTGIAVDYSGNIFVSETGSNDVKMYTKSSGLITTLASGFNTPQGLAVDGLGNVFVADMANNAVKEIVPVGGYYIGPALPAGLAMDRATGVISGTGTVSGQVLIPYTISAYNSFGGSSATTSIQVSAVPAFTYPTPQSYTVSTAIAPLSPTGAGVAAPAYSSTLINFGSGFINPRGTATDSTGAVYVADYTASVIWKYPVVGSPTTVGTGFLNPTSVTIDGLGNLYVADYGNNAVKKIFAGTNLTSSIGSGFNHPLSVAADKVGNVYVADNGNGQIKEVLTNGTTTTISTFTTTNSLCVAVDAKGNLYLGSTGTGSIKMFPAGGGTAVYLGAGFTNPYAIAVDATNNVFVADFTNNAIKEIPAGNGAVLTLSTAVNQPMGIAVDGANNLYIPDYANNLVKRLMPVGGYYIDVLPPGLNFSNTTGVFTGTPTAPFKARDCIVYGYNAGGGNFTRVNIAVKGGANLANLVLTGGILTPAFTSGTIGYTSSVPNSTASVSLTPTASDPAATIKVNGTTVASGASSQNIALVVGSNVITTVVTAADATTKTYTVTVTRQSAQFSVATLSNLTASTGTLSPVFASATNNYAVSEVNAVASITLTPTTTVNGATITVNGVPVTSGSATGGLPLMVGENDFNITVTAQDGTTQNTYSVAVTRAAGSGSSIATLSNLTISSGTLSPVFASATTGYFATVASSVSSMTLVPTATDPNATITVNGAAVASGATSGAIALSPGINKITIIVTSLDGTVQDFYSLGVMRTSNNANLSNLVTSSGTLAPAFVSGTTTYSVSVSNATTSITVTPTTSDFNATVKVNGVAVTSGTASQSVALGLGINSVHAVVLAQDGTQRTYTLNVTRLVNNANLAGLSISAGTLTPAFAPATAGYTASVANTVASITLTPTTSSNVATVKVNGVAVTSGTASQAVPLAVGSNVIYAVVLAQDGTRKTYTVTVTRAISSNANLAGLTLSIGTLSPAFVSATAVYAASVSNATTSITLTPTTSDANATVKVNGVAVLSGHASQSVALGLGTNSVHAVVLAQDGTQKTYTVNVTRLSNNANLSALVVSSGTLSPGFTSANASYTDVVTNATASVQITPTASDVNATVKVNGVSVTSGTASAAINLAVGDNIIYTVVLAQDGTRKTYTTTFHRQTPGGMNNLYVPGNNEQATLISSVGQQVEASNILSPNGDGINDIWVVKNIAFYPDNNVTVYDKAGKVVFTKKGYTNDWAGTYQGSALNTGTYYYKVDLGNGSTVKGFITVLGDR